jgi:ADP-L-glycero-D-manno-heptose 6-epimerase
MEEGLIEKKDPAEYIKMIDIPAELRDKFQFYTFAEGQMESISVITKGNEEKMKDYVKMLIRYNK